MSFTESFSLYNDLEKKTTLKLLQIINKEDKKVAYEVEKSLNDIKTLVDKVFNRMSRGGRLFYIGSGTPGRSSQSSAQDDRQAIACPHIRPET